MPTDRGEAETFAFTDAAAFESWLTENVDHQPGVWLKLAKAGTGIPTLTSDEAVDLGLCFGWISGQRKGLDESYYLQKYVPRRANSRWSLVNVGKVEQLRAAGRMRPSGLVEVAAAQADGRWQAAYESQRHAEEPDDLTAALADHPRAAAAFAAMSRSARYAVFLDLLTCRTPKIRAVHLAKAIAALDSTVD